ncbi:hypothetical protein BYT27DRAFT_6666436 [Phlegmacium glaucopus]|nr:hypothetical protein BYT27DRAFT_6666436 [Phlegmacium glaucopus]
MPCTHVSYLLTTYCLHSLNPALCTQTEYYRIYLAHFTYYETNDTILAARNNMSALSILQILAGPTGHQSDARLGSQFASVLPHQPAGRSFHSGGTAGWFRHLFATIERTRRSGLARTPLQIISELIWIKRLGRYLRPIKFLPKDYAQLRLWPNLSARLGPRTDQSPSPSEIQT